MFQNIQTYFLYCLIYLTALNLCAFLLLLHRVPSQILPSKMHSSISCINMGELSLGWIFCGLEFI